MSDVIGIVYAVSLSSPSLPSAGFLLAVFASAFGPSSLRTGRLAAPRATPTTTGTSTGTGTGNTTTTVPAGPTTVATAAAALGADRQTAAGWDPVVWDALADRLSVLTRAFLAAVVPRVGRPVQAHPGESAAQEVMTALERAMDLLTGATLGDSPVALAAAVHEAELRWRRLTITCRSARSDDDEANPASL